MWVLRIRIVGANGPSGSTLFSSRGTRPTKVSLRSPLLRLNSLMKEWQNLKQEGNFLTQLAIELPYERDK